MIERTCLYCGTKYFHLHRQRFCKPKCFKAWQQDPSFTAARLALAQNDPDPQEIKVMCAEIQAGWSKKEERLRRGASNEPFELNPVSVRR